MVKEKDRERHKENILVVEVIKYGSIHGPLRRNPPPLQPLFFGYYVNIFCLDVTSPYGNNLHQNEKVTHCQFAFTTSEASNYLACFWIDTNKHVQGEVPIVSLDWKTRIVAKD
ncbi:hypothetical protein L6164_037329 [Bauhinia variegata]|uniref:Uncharacterized protein n=1 Tax=Bauhinia variegata TaxID=167791 RepID=A0ACB9KJN3_BAUVA|nr:hypothetical protein L6164_037329 [Bauhinia variegata]